MAVVNFEGITFDGASYDAGFGLADLPGWYDGAPVRDEGRRRPTSNGNFGVDRFHRDARVISVEGAWTGSSIEEAYEARARIEGIQASGVPSRFEVVDHFGTRWVTARLASAPQCSAELFSPRFTYAFDVIADDPRKYGEEVVSTTGLPSAGTGYVWPALWPADWGSGGDPGRVDLVNAGKVDTHPLLEVSGGLGDGVELVEVVTGSVLRLERVIPLGSTVFFNTRTARVYLDDPANDISSFLTRREWSGFAVPAAGSRTVQFNGLGLVSGTPLLTARYSPAF